ncbi:hypothetical protein B9D06_22165 [Mycobacterium tuberculosis]|nr:hypothetical protein B9D06_22165 [Mycobacterium tuberculosis]
MFAGAGSAPMLAAAAAWDDLASEFRRCCPRGQFGEGVRRCGVGADVSGSGRLG